MTHPFFEPLTLVFELIGTVAFALSGVMEGVRKELDILGIVVVGTVTAVGGGALRDVLLGILPPVMFTKPVYALVAVATCIVAFTVLRIRGPRSIERLDRLNPVINVFDAVGLGVFAVVGVDTALRSGYAANPFLSIFVGTVTGVGGGLMRDILIQTIPRVLKKRVYALAAFAGASLYYALRLLLVNAGFAMLASVGVVVLIRLLASRFQWNLPRIRILETAPASPTEPLAPPDAAQEQTRP